MRIPSQSASKTLQEKRSRYSSVCVARSTGDFNQGKRLRRNLRRQLEQDRDNEWASRAKELEKEDKNPRKELIY
ncbi:hypothetical protein RB195_022276 [Necator americanus]|uniref:IBB domain-containing protein n=1 Tax=Necator americanus TaxID=51031 RepID=A0ABR1EEN0_NECAM